MEDMSSVYILNPGDAEGHLSFVSSGRMVPSDILYFHPEIQKELDEIEKKGWKYLYIETMATSKAEITLVKSKFQIKPNFPQTRLGHIQVPKGRIVELTIGEELPRLVAVPKVDVFKVNVCSKSFPRAATVDLSKSAVTYLHGPFWNWEPGFETDEKKLSNAMEIYEIATWMIEEKKFKLTEEVTETRWNELSPRFRKMAAGTGRTSE